MGLWRAEKVNRRKRIFFLSFISAIAMLVILFTSPIKAPANLLFQPAVSYYIGASGGPAGLVTGDFNGDGILDLAVVSRSFSSTVSIYLGNSDGTFIFKGSSTTGNGSNGITAGDFNSDGRLDLAVVNSSGNSMSVLSGNGDGSFQPRVDYPAVNSPSDVVAGDFNADGKLDLVVTNGGNNLISVLKGNGDGTFQNVSNATTGLWKLDGITAGDFNGDGKPDLAIADSADTQSGVSVFVYGNSAGSFFGTVNNIQFSNYTRPRGVAAGDFNGDGKLDLAAANSGSNNVSILLGNGNATFSLRGNVSVLSNPNRLVAGDFNGDGKTDLAVANNGVNQVSILAGNGNGTFQPADNYVIGSAGTNPNWIIAGDFNGDGRPDLAVSAATNNISVLLATTTPTVTTAPVTLITSTGSTVEGEACSDGGLPVTARGFVYATNMNPALSDAQVVVTGTTGPFTAALTGLTPGATYHVRAFATNSLGTSYGNDVSFTTLAPPTVTTSTASAISPTGAKVEGNVTSDGGATVTARGFVYSTNPDPTVSDSQVPATGTTGTFTSWLTGLTPAPPTTLEPSPPTAPA